MNLPEGMEQDLAREMIAHIIQSREGNGNPLQCSCLENLRDGGAWWAAICGVTQSWIQLKQFSISSNIPLYGHTTFGLYIYWLLAHKVIYPFWLL